MDFWQWQMHGLLVYCYRTRLVMKSVTYQMCDLKQFSKIWPQLYLSDFIAWLFRYVYVHICVFISVLCMHMTLSFALQLLVLQQM